MEEGATEAVVAKAVAVAVVGAKAVAVEVAVGVAVCVGCTPLQGGAAEKTASSNTKSWEYK
jgi:hypothetical protein